MHAIETVPIREHWITTGLAAVATAAALAGRVGHLDVAALDVWRPAIAVAGRELAAAADAPWPLDDDSPLVALLRAIGRLAVVAPDATSETAGALLEAIGADLRERSSRRA